MDITAEAALQLDPSKAAVHAVHEIESLGFLTKSRPAWSGHPAAPTWLVVASRNRLAPANQKQGMHTPVL
jgi:hypothetical protein